MKRYYYFEMDLMTNGRGIKGRARRFQRNDKPVPQNIIFKLFLDTYILNE